MRLRIRYDDTKKLVSACFLMTILFAFRCISDIFIYPAVGIGILLVCTLKIEECFPFLLFLLPWSTVYKLSPTQVSFFTILYLIYIFRITNRLRVKPKFIYFFIIFVVYLLISSGMSKIIAIITMICGFLMIYRVCEQYNYKNAIYASSWGLITSSLIALAIDYLPLLQQFVIHELAKFGEGEYAYRFSGLDGNPNYYTIGISIVLSCLTVMIFREKKNKMNIVLFCVLSILGLMSVSKSFLVVWLILVVVLFIQALKNGLKKTIMIVAFLCIGGAIAYYFAFDAVNLYIMRLSGIGTQNLSEITTSRSTIWDMYITYIIHDLKTILIGNGLNPTLLNGRGPHNTYIEIMYSFGIIGTILFLIILRQSIHLTKANKIDVLLWLPVLILLIRLFAIGTLTYENLPFYISLICLMIVYYRRER